MWPLARGLKVWAGARARAIGSIAANNQESGLTFVRSPGRVLLFVAQSELLFPSQATQARASAEIGSPKGSELIIAIDIGR